MTDQGTGDAQQPGWAPPPVPPFIHGQPPQPMPQQPGYGPYGQQQPFYGYPAAYARPGTSGLAIASMVLGILWLYWIGSILAIVFGYVALGQIKRQPGLQGRGMAIAGVVLGWVGVAMIVLGLLFVVAARNG